MVFYQTRPYAARRDMEIAAIIEEHNRARNKFPAQDVWKTLAALTEEVGELNQAVLQYYDEPQKNIELDDIHKEARQVAVMALRILLDVDV
jgi:NTP pyrophosphatase (non-canonical NTP hydrolase)